MSNTEYFVNKIKPFIASMIETVFTPNMITSQLIGRLSPLLQFLTFIEVNTEE